MVFGKAAVKVLDYAWGDVVDDEEWAFGDFGEGVCACLVVRLSPEGFDVREFDVWCPLGEAE